MLTFFLSTPTCYLSIDIVMRQLEFHRNSTSHAGGACGQWQLDRLD